uniref:Uncharacterized protein n=1 Tax=Phthorimaea operculella granulovirus TaxID=192584 RepID=A0A1B2CS64_9BBAC|nr:hypothetical protein PhopGVgp093 [Phthorimaea operculella granulovirus]
MNNHIYDDSARIQKTQQEILQQHKYLETQINQLRDSIRSVCSNNGIKCPGVDNNFEQQHNFGQPHNLLMENQRKSVIDHHFQHHRAGIRRF